MKFLDRVIDFCLGVVLPLAGIKIYALIGYDVMYADFGFTPTKIILLFLLTFAAIRCIDRVKDYETRITNKD